MRRMVVSRGSGPTGTRRTVGAGGDATPVSLDNRPLAIALSRDGKRVLVTLPYELLLLDARDLSVLRNHELIAERPSVAEDLEGLLWIGGPHLYRASSWGGSASKAASKLGGVVDRVALLRPGLLAGVGTHGELLWDVETQQAVHRRKTSEREVHALVATPEEQAVFADGSPAAWVIDPTHASGYAQLRFKRSSPDPVHEEGIVALAVTSHGRCVLGARDGAVAWTHPDLRIAIERFPQVEAGASEPREIVGDAQWIYVLRDRGVLQRFLIDPPPPPPRPDRGRRPPPPASNEEPPLPLAQACRLERVAECMALVERGGATQLLLGGPHGDGQLGRLWYADPEQLPWEALPLGKRSLKEKGEAAPGGAAQMPDFTATRNKLRGGALRDIKVDAVVSGEVGYWLTTTQGTLLDRPVVPAAEAPEPMAGDALLLPAMLRLREGTARPGLLLWPGTARSQAPLPAPIWLTWGDAASGWIVLDTPQIRAQRWSRSDVFPMQIAIKSAPPAVPGRRLPLAKRWFDDALFTSLASECKRALKVLW